MRRSVIIAIAIVILMGLATAVADDLGGYAATASGETGSTVVAYLPLISDQEEPIYTSSNLSGHTVFAECNPGGVSDCPCSESDAAIMSSAQYGEVISNAREANTYVNAIGYRKFTETFPDGEPIALGVYSYAGQFSLPLVPRPDIGQRENPEAAHVMMQLWDGRNALFDGEKKTLEGTIFWQLNPWTADYGKIKIYTEPLTLIDTGILIEPDTRWHSFELVVDFANQRYVSIVVDGERRDVSDVPLATVYHPEWGDDVSLAITTESTASWPQAGCPYVFTWTMRYRDLRLGK